MNKVFEVTPEEGARILLMDELRLLPQFRHFDEANVERFIRIRKNDPRALWHVMRLSGIGGSEIGVLVAEHRGIDDAFGETAAGLIRDKLLIVPPKRTTMAMRKGIVSENSIRQIFLEDYKATQDQEILDKMANSELKSRHSWMRYSPDDIVAINGLRYLVDYKNPGEATLHDDLKFRYICQLHQGRMLLEENGVHIDGMLLAQFPEAGQGDDLVVSEVIHDESVDHDIIEAGSTAWGMILSGTVPDYKPRNGQDGLPEEVKATIDEMSLEFSRYKAMSDAILEKQKDVQKRMVGLLSAHGLSENAVFSGVKVSAGGKFDPAVAMQSIGDDANAALVPVLSAKIMQEWFMHNRPDVNLTQFHNGEFTVDEPLLVEMLTDRKMDKDQFTSPAYRFTVRSSDDYKEKIGAMVAAATESAPLPDKPTEVAAKKKASPAAK